MTRELRYVCARCGERFWAWSRAQAHANEGHARIEMCESKLGERND